MTTIDGESRKIGGDGLGLGVKLAVSDKQVQVQNKQMLGSFLRNQQKRKKQLEEKRKAQE